MRLRLLLIHILIGVARSQYPTPPSESHQSVDHIESIEIDATQIIITTSKNGPADKLKIHIELVDIDANKMVNPVDLSGLWLTITRGRYTIPFLRPDTWYGVRFRSENEINGKTIVHEDERLIRTKPRDAYTPPALATLPPPLIGLPPPISTPNNEEMHKTNDSDEKIDDNQLDVKMHRSLDGVETYESLYVTVSWRKKAGRSNSTTGLVDIRVVCDHTETREKVKLESDEDAVTIEISMDQKYDIEETDPSRHQIKAHITPLKCHKLCWKSELLVASAFGEFKRPLGEACRDIEGTTSTTYLRELKKISVVENEMSVNELIIETAVAESEYGVVTLLLEKLGSDNETFTMPIKKSFDTNTSNGKFVVPIDDDAIYAVQYEYVKTRPFHYTTKSHFLVESPSPNSTKPDHPLIEISTIPKSFEMKRNGETILKPEPPFVLLSRSSHYSNHDVVLHLDEFCHENATRVRLEDRYPEHQIDAVAFLCGLEPKMHFCDQNATYRKCDSMLCFSTSVIIGQDSYDSESRCLNVSQHFPPLQASSSNVFIALAILVAFLVRFR
ncbi:unnamed protein product [Caenorhabditis bovis]|uniref:Uncharacterized protein n=1 Tax=Caenorhabditis bovis TaxID=2654633 RepID=A0A8S1F4H3_9PELO|nr:unnamed protein product [Caenorhabditis bovis]